jgi:hypothetical protein
LDNRFFFVFSEPPVRRAVVVSDDVKSGETFRRALAIPRDVRHQHQVDVIPVTGAAEIDWEKTGLLIWQAALPRGLVAEQIKQFVDAGRVVMFFPPRQGADETLFGSRWTDWQTSVSQQVSNISWWRGDADLLAHVESGDALPLNELRTYRYCSFESHGTPLARLDDDASLLTRVATDRGGVYFCSTLPTAEFSSLEREGVVFYVMLQRALEQGCRALAVASQRDAGPDVLADRNQWDLVASVDDSLLLSQRGLHAGVYRDGTYWAAVNRSQIEDSAAAVPAASVDALFDGVSYRRIDVDVGDTSPLASELWRIFLIAMVVALLAESVLSLPGRRVKATPLIDRTIASGSAGR